MFLDRDSDQNIHYKDPGPKFRNIRIQMVILRIWIQLFIITIRIQIFII